MGFFLTEAQAQRAQARSQRDRKPGTEKVLGQRGCDACPLRERWGRITTPQMKISGNRKDPDILVLGEAPGEEEDREGEAFVGASGKLLRDLIPGRELSRLAFTNSVRCRPLDNATPSAEAVHSCSSHLERDVLAHDFRAILGVGGVPLQQFFPGASILAVSGAKFVVEIGGKLLWYYPVYHPSFVLRGSERRGVERTPAYAILRAQLKIFFKRVDKWPAPTIDRIKPEDVLLPQSLDEAEAIYARMQGALGLDFETGTETAAVLKPYKRGARLLTTGVSDGALTMAFPVQHPDRPTNWGMELTLRIARERRWVAHNAQFELLWLLWHGQAMDPHWQPHDFEDSMAMARVYHERTSIVALEDVTRIHLGIDTKRLTNINPARIMDYSVDEILPYQGIDAWASARIMRRMRKNVGHEEQYIKFLETIRSFTEMELDGLPVDLDETDRLHEEWSDKAAEIERRAAQLYEVRQFERDTQTEFNLASNEQLGEALVRYGNIDLERGKDKKYITDEEALAAKAADNPLAKAALEHREAARMDSTYCVAIITHIESNVDGILHPSYTTLRTHTTRGSGIDPNMQNWPTRKQKSVRRQIVAPPGHLIVAMDMKQLEARVFGMASKDAMLCSSIISGEDIHSHWLKIILDMCPEYIVRLIDKTNSDTEEEAAKEGRNIIKTDFVFASFYGSMAKSVAERTGIPLEIVTEVLAQFWRRYSGAKKWGDQQRAMYADTGSVMLLNGFMRHGLMNGNEPFNTPIQGTGARLVLDAQNDLAAMARRERDSYLRARINVHDDLTFILPAQSDRAEDYIRTIVPELIKIRYNWQIIPLAVEVKAGKNWESMEKITDFTGDYIR